MKDFGQLDIKMSKKELEQRIRQYYLKKDPSIVEVDVEVSERYTSGQWDEAWQRNIGGCSYGTAKIKVTRRMTAFGEEREIEDVDSLEEGDILEILSALLRAEGLVAKYLHAPFSLSEDKLWKVNCERITAKENGTQTNKTTINQYRARIKHFMAEKKREAFIAITGFFE